MCELIEHPVIIQRSTLGNVEVGGPKGAPSVNDTLRNLSHIMDFALKDTLVHPKKSAPTSPMLSPSFSRGSKRRKRYNTVSVFPRSLVEATAGMLVTEEEKP